MNGRAYTELVAELFPRLTGGVRWGLGRTRRLLAAAGDPHLACRVIHVGGTNGKGSVAAQLESVLRHSGCRTGLYSSPHLCTFRERIRIDGRAIDEAALLSAAHRLKPCILEEEASFFEATTAIAFLALAEAGVDTAVVEVGLGGRLDSTNVVQPDVVVLTNVSLDHLQLLGPTVQHIAREKAGIIKAGVPLVTAEVDGPAADIIAATAAARAAPLRVVAPADVMIDDVSLAGTSFRVRGTAWGELSLTTPLIGAHQAINAALAVHALGCLADPLPAADAVRAGIAGVRWRGRLQVERIGGVTWVFDVAHNVAGVDAMRRALAGLGLPRPLAAVVGVLGDKDWPAMLTPIVELADTVLLTQPPTAPQERRWDPAAVLTGRAGGVFEGGTVRVASDFVPALESAYAFAAPRAGTVLVTGSFHTVGDAMVALGLCEDGSDAEIRRAVLALPAAADRV